MARRCCCVKKTNKLFRLAVSGINDWFGSHWFRVASSLLLIGSRLSYVETEILQDVVNGVRE
jgi:hypothetical protein